ncbi:MAG: solute carrier family 23 protein [Schaedlerella sp.]|nr:solute carrier family 23 protein [Schaedlerella sp.]
MSKAKTQTNVSVENVYKLDGRVPLGKAIPFGLQHVLAMFVANLVPVLIVMSAAVVSSEGGRNFDAAEVSGLLQCAMFAAGVGTAVQLYPIWRIGSKLPIVMGCSFTFLAAMLGIATNPELGYEALIGSIIVGGCIEGTLGLTAKYWRKYLDDIVPACVVMAIGFSLLSVGMNSFGGGQGAADFGAWYHLVIAVISLIACLVYKAVVKGVWRNIDILFGIAVGYVLSVIFTVTGIAAEPMVDFAAFGTTIDQLGWIEIPLPVFLKGTTPVFDFGSIVAMTIVFLVSAAETIGGTAAVAMDGLGRPVTDREVSGSLGVDGYGSAFSGLFGACPITSFNQNIGLIAMTRVVNRFTILMGALILIIASFFPPIGAFFNTIPDAVLGGCMVMMYGSIIFSGLKMIAGCGDTERNMTIVAISFCVGVGVTQVDPAFFSALPKVFTDVFAGNSVAGVFVISLILSFILPKGKEN